MKYDDWFILDQYILYGFIVFTFVGSYFETNPVDFKHPTNQFLTFFVLPIAVIALLVVLTLYLSGDIYKLNCDDVDCKINSFYHIES